MFQALTVSDLTGKLAVYGVPTLIVNGEHDNALKGGLRTASLIAHAEHKILPGTGHCCFLEDPAGFDRARDRFSVAAPALAGGLSGSAGETI